MQITLKRPYLKYWLGKNSKFGKTIPKFIPPSIEEYEKYLEQDSGGICSHGPGSNHIRPYWRYVERCKGNHDSKHDPNISITINQQEFSGDSEKDSLLIKQIEEKEDFIRWLEK